MQIAKLVDARGLRCPMPIVKVKKAMDAVASGEVVELLASDRGSLKDVPAWAQSSGHQLLESRENGGTFAFYIRKA